MDKRVWFVIMAMGLAVLACAGDVPAGSLKVNDSPVTLTMRGEITHVFEATVSPGKTYEVLVTRGTFKVPFESLYFSIYVVSEDPSTNIASSLVADEQGAAVKFSGPKSGSVKIKIYEHVGETQDDMGTVTVQLREIE